VPFTKSQPTPLTRHSLKNFEYFIKK